MYKKSTKKTNNLSTNNYYFPIQKLEKISPKSSSLVFIPTTSANKSLQAFKFSATTSSDSLALIEDDIRSNLEETSEKYSHVFP